MMSAPMLRLEGVQKSFGGLTAVAALSLEVPAGCVAGLMGPNGAGKTTVINLITGLLRADSGVIALDGAPVQHLPVHAIAARGIARTYQNVRLFAGMTALEQVMAGSYLRRRTSLMASFLALPSARAALRMTRRRALDLLARVGMAARADELAETLSYGEQRRIEIARALGAGPRLLLLDEPTAGMNAQESEAIGRLVHTLRDDGLTVLMVEHNVRLVSDFCDQVTVMSFGRALVHGTPTACMADPEVQEAYFGRKEDAQRIRALR
ncbi:MAG: ABC transporter ATP-binding protein [Rhodospirillales bacterium]|nr:ABC transporter ATP-binding protein [Rhodospirillales bacterium]MDE2577068.1 ABC transporter ATP-binding protein [Rhodospirillales bacterium]